MRGKSKKKKNKTLEGGEGLRFSNWWHKPLSIRLLPVGVGLLAVRNENKADHTHGTEKKQGKSYYKYAAFLKFSLKCSMLYVKLKTIWRSKRKNKTSTHTQ